MTFPTGKQQNDLPKMMELQDAMARMGAQINQTNRILFLAVEAAGGKVELSEAKIPVGWRLDKIRKDDGTLVLTSSVTPPPTEEQIDALANKLRGTKINISDVQKELKLEDWPESYLAFQLSTKLLIDGSTGTWREVSLVKAEATHRGLN